MSIKCLLKKEGGEGLNFKEERKVGSKRKERKVEVFLTGEEKKGEEKVEELSAWEEEEEGEGKESQVYRVPRKQRLGKKGNNETRKEREETYVKTPEWLEDFPNFKVGRTIAGPP